MPPNDHDHRRAIRITIATLPPPDDAFCSAGCPKFVKTSESCRQFGRLDEVREPRFPGPPVRYIVRHKRCREADAGPVEPVPSTQPRTHGRGCACARCSPSTVCATCRGTGAMGACVPCAGTGGHGV